MSHNIEYESLRQEILEDRQREFNILSLSLTTVAALIGFSFSTMPREPFMFLTPLPILTVALFQLKNVLYSSLTKAVHIRIVIESQDPSLNWEQCINDYRDMLRSKARRGFPLFQISAHMMVLIVMGVSCIVMALYFSDRQYQPLSLAVLFAWVLFSVYINRKIQYAVSGKYEREVEKKWAKIWAKRQRANRAKVLPNGSEVLSNGSEA